MSPTAMFPPCKSCPACSAPGLAGASCFSARAPLTTARPAAPRAPARNKSRRETRGVDSSLLASRSSLGVSLILCLQASTWLWFLAIGLFCDRLNLQRGRQFGSDETLLTGYLHLE